MKEYGGYLPLELCQKSEFYFNEDVIRLNSGRSAIISAIIDGGFEKVYIPIYLCKSVSEALKKANINFLYYNIDHNFMPINLNLSEDECILYPNYFGIISEDKLYEISIKYNNVIFDNTQAFFSKPILKDYNVYSCRKFFGVSDGAYLIKNRMKKLELGEDISSIRANFLLKSIEYGTNASYKDNINNEELIEKSSILFMSKLTQKILASIDYDSIIKKRQSNIKYVHQKLKKYNKLSNLIYPKSIMMAYPFLNCTTGLREYLVENKIYVPQWWKYILESNISNDFEKELSSYLMPIPIDQRYDTSDMEYICELILNYVKG